MNFHITPCCNEIDCRDVPAILSAVGFPQVSTSEVSRFTSGAINATFGVRHEALDLVLKVSTRPHKFLFPNKLVVDHFAHDQRVRSKLPQVLDYDFRSRTPHEALVMRRSLGTILLHDMDSMQRNELELLFGQLLELVGQLFTFESPSGLFGDLNEDTSPRFRLASDFLLHNVESNLAFLVERRLCYSDHIPAIRRYVEEYAQVFDASHKRPVLVHQDIQWNNVLHDGPQLCALLDFDSAMWALV